MVYLTNQEDLTFEKINQIMSRNMRPKKRLVVAEKTRLMSIKQEIDQPIIKYLHHLRNASRYCELEKLKQEEQTIEEDLIQLRLIGGMYSWDPQPHKYWPSVESLKVFGQKTFRRHYYLSTLPRPSIPYTEGRWNKSY